MSLDLYQDETRERLASLRPVSTPEVGAFDNFVVGSAKMTMRGFASAASGIDIAGGALASIQDKIMGTGNQAQDLYFKEHEDVLGSAVDYWTPRPNEVGAASEVVGGLLSTLPLVILSPAAAIAGTQLGTAEDLSKKGVSSEKAQGVGAVQGAGLGLGIWMPILGQNGWQRVLIGGAGYNAAQGVVMRGASGAILEGTPAADEFKAFDGKALTLDVLMGMAFGSLAHLSPSQRQQGAQYWDRLTKWAESLDPSQVDSIAALRQSQHMNVDSVPGKLEGVTDIEAHTQRLKAAIDQLSKGEPVAVDDLRMPLFGEDAKRIAQQAKDFEALRSVADRVAADEDLPHFRHAEIDKFLETQRVTQGEEAVRKAASEATAKVKAEDVPAFLRSAEDLIALRADEESSAFEPIVKQAIEIAKKPGFDRTAEEKILLDSILSGKLRDFLQPRNAKEQNVLGESVTKALAGMKKTGAPAGQPRGAEPPPPRGPSEGKPAGAEATSPHLAEAMRIAEEHPDLKVRTGMDANGEPVSTTAKEFVEQASVEATKIREQAKLLTVAAECMLGVM